MIKLLNTLLLIILFIGIHVQSNAQAAPGGIIFQAAARDLNNYAAANRNIYAIVNILEGSSKGTNAYKESWQVVSNNEGIFTITIGQGTRISGVNSLLNLDWLTKTYFFNIQIAIQPTLLDPSWTPTNNYIDIGTTQFWSVPYAITALSSKFSDSATTINSILPSSKGGTGFDNNGKSIILANNIITKGIGDLTITTTAASDVIFPTSGTIATLKDINDILKVDTLSLSKRINLKVDKLNATIDSSLYVKGKTTISDTLFAKANLIVDSTIFVKGLPIATLTGVEALKNKSINGVTPTSLANGFKVSGGTITNTTLTVIGDVTVGGVNSGDQLITLTGDASGSGTGTFTTTINTVGGLSSATITTLPTLIASNTASITSNTNSIASNTASITINNTNLLLRATIASPSFTGTPTAPTPLAGSNSTQIATTAYVANFLAPDADANTKGKVQLAGDLGGTASAPLVNKIGGKSITLGGVLTTAGALITAGNYTTTINTIDNTNITLPTTGTIATLSGTETLTNKIINGITPSSLSTGFSLTGGSVNPKILTVLSDVTLGGVNTGDQYVELTGDVKGGGFGTFTTTVNSVGGVSSTTISALPTLIASNTSSITTNTNVISSNTASITSNIISITANTASITSNTNSIATNTVSITSNTNSITANTASITANTADILLRATIASPSFTGTPTAVTAAPGTSTTQIATTAFVTGIVGGSVTYDADASTKGKLKLTNDLGGTADLPTVNSVGGISSSTIANRLNSVTSTNANNTIVARNGTGGFAAGAIAATSLTLNDPLAIANGGTGTNTATGTGSVVLSTSPAFTGTPTAVTAAPGTSTNQIATTAFVSGIVGGSITYDADASTKGKLKLTNDLGGTADLPTVNSVGGLSSSTIANRLNSITSTNVNNTIVARNGTGGFAAGAIAATSLTLTDPLAITNGGTGTNTATGTGSVVLSTSPALTGTPTAVTAAPGTSTNQIATTAFVTGIVGGSVTYDADAGTKGKLKLTNDLGGTADLPVVNSVGGISSTTISTLPTLIASNTSSITTNTADILLRATIASPSFTGTPTAVTAAPGTSTNQIATTAFVTGIVGGSVTYDADAGTKGKLKLTNDLGGTADLPIVTGIGGKSIVLGGALITSGNYTTTISTTGTTNVTLPTSGTLATTDYVSSSVSGGATFDADASTKGKLKLTNDLGGTADLPTVNSVGGISSTTISTLPTLIASNTSSITSNTNKIAANTASITSNTNSIAANTVSITSNTNSIATNTASITAEIARATNAEAGLDTRISSNTTNITANTADILLRATIASPSFTGTPTAVTAAPGTSTNQIATTAFVTGLVGGSITYDADASTKGKLKLTNDLGGTADLPTVNSVGGISSTTISTFPTLIASNTSSITSNTNKIAANTVSITSNTNSIAANTVSITSNTNSIATNTTSIIAEIARATNAEAGLDARVSLNTTSITANTTDISLRATIASPSFTGTPTAVTAAPGTSTNQIATTAFVTGIVGGSITYDADASTKGKLKLTNDLGGTADLPTVNSVGGLSSSTIANRLNSVTSTNANNTIVARNGTGGFAAGAIAATSLTLTDPLAITNGGTGTNTATGTGSVVLSTSPALTGTPTAVTAAPGTSTNQIATTAFVTGIVGGSVTYDADASTKGKLKLTNDLGGTADLPTVTGIGGKSVVLGGALITSGNYTTTIYTTGTTNVTLPTSGTLATTSYVSSSVSGGATLDADASTKGKLKLANDLGGTADLPTVNSVGGILSTTIATAINSATSSNTVNTLVKRDASGNFAAAAITANALLTNTLKVTGGTPIAYAVLTSDANGNATWGSNGLYSLNNQNASNHTFLTANTASSDFTITSTLGTGILSNTAFHTFNLPDAGISTRGVITTGTQTFAGSKTFSGTITVGTLKVTAGTPTTGGYVLTASGMDGTAVWQAATLGLTGVGTMTTTAYPNGASVSGNNIILAAADGTYGGVLTNGTQTIAGQKSFKSAVTNLAAYDAGSSTTIDFSQSNLAFTTASPGAFTLTGLRNGGTYTLAVQGTVSGTAVFTSTGFNFISLGNYLTVAGKQTVYTFTVMGPTGNANVYYSMVSEQ